ncbi:Cytochrome c oxidase subunit CcoP [Minicystis rosea]|nr:Cytochrome c oxidase subunit CcoP [Minicystis rosea]
MSAERDPRSRIVHEYDGIQEQDNDLPRWWLWCFYATIVFSIGYWFHYQTFGVGIGPMAAHDAEDAALRAAEAEQIKKSGAVSAAMLLTLSKDPATVAEGKSIFTSTCASCHASNGGGGIGPNLTDDAWLHGGAPDHIYKTIKDGFPSKGMAAWGPVLGEARVRAAAAYVVSIKGTNVAGGKAPQGEKEAP